MCLDNNRKEIYIDIVFKLTKNFWDCYRDSLINADYANYVKMKHRETGINANVNLNQIHASGEGAGDEDTRTLSGGHNISGATRILTHSTHNNFVSHHV